MKQILCAAIIAVIVAGCGKPVARMQGLSRVQAAVLVDANSFARDTQSRARPPIHVTDPDRLAALERFLSARQKSWKKADGTPRATRFQLELIANDRPLYTVWLEPGYMAMASGKLIQEARLTNAETAELLACLGLPPDFLNPTAPMPPGYPAVPAGYAPPGSPLPPQQMVIPAGAEAPASKKRGSVKL